MKRTDGGNMKKETINMNYTIDGSRMTDAVIHGEVLLIPVTAIPDESVEVFNGEGFVAGHSETGHHHVIEGVATGYSFKPLGGDDELTFLRADSATKIKHLKTFDRHNDMPVAPGLYIVLHSQEYDLFEGVMRKVVD